MKTAAHLLTLIALANFTSAQDSSQAKASLADFKEFCQQMQGRWVTQQKVTTVWPKLGFKQGDTLTHYTDFQKDLDGIVLVAHHQFGNIKWRVTYHYDAVNSKICSNGNGSNGFWSKGLIWKLSKNEFRYSVEGGQANGDSFSSTGSISTSADRKQMTNASGDTRLGDGAKAKSRVIYKRISP
ncbi:MAG: hypothetical protein VX438_09415 [Planctomycetota bacterium]|nr:hypothetical protein [Planctomycetota bacterium]